MRVHVSHKLLLLQCLKLLPQLALALCSVVFRNLPLAVIMGVLSVAVVYLLTNIAYFSVLTMNEMISSPAVVVVSICQKDAVLRPLSFRTLTRLSCVELKS